MKKVLVIGSGGAGKSTFAARLTAKTGLPLVHLDSVYWRPGWEETPKDEWRRTVERLVAGEAWLMDGNFGGTLELRLAACDTVVFLDLPRTLCLWRVLMRRLRYLGRARPDMSPGCPERLTWKFLHWIWTYPRLRRPEILARLDALRGEKNVVVLRSQREVEEFLK
ncbi:DNA topology modulation protein [Vitiosangium sp. GDMCC 1.1324]|uniref:DNA topology modulation protein n=1 Tax=Vitiosangium sp. (strain GDMCC 1.1324) TaxID=2138576 RepID=UPI000D3C4308|nr:DNA topology modulation protein [Vitiosangium sp. GDMCC 1.1324]PTL80863.1 AAA family ATPase [Vitiosangium sp. GDMCC 1.1324]